MGNKKGYLTDLTREEIINIRNYAPSKVELTEVNYLEGIETVQNLYDEYEEVMGNKNTTTLQKKNWRLYKKKADNKLLEEVELLSKKLMDEMLTSSSKDKKGVRQLLKEVLDYQEVLEETVEKNNNETITYETGQGYLLFKDWTDEEIEHFWNG